MQKYLTIAWRVLAIVIITAGGAAITCGGNLVIPEFLGLHGGEFGPGYLFILWIMEIISIFLLSIYSLFWRGDQKKKKIIYFIISILLVIGIFSALYSY